MHGNVPRFGSGAVFLEGQRVGAGDEDGMAGIVTCHEVFMLSGNNGSGDGGTILADFGGEREAVP